MPWYAPWSNVIKKKVCRFLLQRYLGQFIEEKLSLDQLNVDFYNGTGTVRDVTLYCRALNDLCEGQGWGIEVICGHIGAVTVNIPYEAPLAKDSSIEVTNLSITLRPKARITDGTSMFESMWSSMSSSMQLAQECLERDGGCIETPSATPTNTIEGLEKFAQIIDNVLNRIKARLIDTEVRIEYLPPDSDCGIALIVKIKSIEYQNEAGNDPPDRQEASSDDGSQQQEQQQQKQKSFLISTHATHHISMEGITFYTEEFRIHDPRQQRRRQQQKQQQQKQQQDNRATSVATEQFLSTISDLPDPMASTGTLGVGSEFFSYTSACDNSSSSSKSYRRTDSGGSPGGAISGGEEDDDGDDNVIYLRSGEILAGKVTSKQEIRLKMKQADHLSGPNVELEMSLGCLQLFLSPRQLHSIILLSDTFLGANEIPGPVKCSPPDLNSRAQHYEETEFEFKHNSNRMSGGIGLNQGWSLADPMQTMIQEQAEFLESDYRDEGGMSEMIESSNSSMNSSFTSSSMASRTTSASRRRMIDPDADADISKFNVRVGAVAFVLLHEDLLVESSQIGANDSPLSEASVQKLQAKAEQFFWCVSNLGLGLGANDILNAGLKMDSGCDSSHLRLLLAPIIVEGEEQRNRLGSVLRFSISIARADLREVLTDISVPLVEFYREKSSSALPKRPEVMINFKQTCNALKGSSGKRFTAPRTEIRFSLAQFLTEFDITILDRLSSLIYQLPFASYYNQPTPVNSPASPTNTGINRKMEAKTEIRLESPSIEFRLRFPIPDLRPIHDSQRVPWWRRNIRPDFILVKLQQARASIALNPHPLFDISANEILLFYHESELKPDSVNIGKAVMTDNLGSKYSPTHSDGKQEQTGVEYPRIVIEIPNDAVIQKLQEPSTQPKPDQRNRGNYEESDSDPTSSESFGVTTGKSKEDTPFSAKRVCRESDTPHTKASADDPETLTLPGDSEELNTFCDAAMKLSKLQIRIFLPVVSLQLKSKHLYEVIYNRISTDLLLWEPSAPAATAAAEASANLNASKVAFQEPHVNLASMGMMDSIYAPFTMCQSAIQLDSSSSATNSESESDSDGIFYSVYDRNSKRHHTDGGYDEQRKQYNYQQHSIRRQQQQHRKALFIDRSNAISFQLNIGQGMLTMFAPVRDAQNHVIPGQLGEFIIKLNSTYVFSVNGFHGNSNLGYLCIQGKAADIFHCGLIPSPANNPPLRLVNSVLPSYICSTLYPTPKNLTVNEQRGCPNREMFSLAIQIKAIPEQSIKRIRMAAGVQLTTLRHHSTLPQHSWLTQLLDMFDVVDYPVQGYTPFGVLTEMHLHLWDCAIDYRPLYFPYRAVITIGSFMISSNITSESAGLTLRFIAEDAALCLAPQIVSSTTSATNEKEQQKKSSTSVKDDNKVTVFPSNDLVCLVELGLFEISLRLNVKATNSFPKFDLRTAINDVHVRTCADSAQALAQLIGYLAAEGDLLLQDDGSSDIGDEESVGGLPMGGELEGELLPVKTSQAPEVTPKQQQRVNTLMAEAMEESLALRNRGSELSRDDQLLADGEGVEVFFFPDEDHNRVAARKKLVNNLVSDHSNKRRFASDDDSLSIEEGSSVPSSYQDDDNYLKQRQFDEQSEDTGSVNTEMRELLNFECSVMGMQKEGDDDDEVVEALPQVTMDLGDVSKFEGSSPNLSSNVGNNSQRKVSSDTDEDFCFIADEERPHCGNQEVPVLEEPIRIVDNHFSVPMGKPDLLLAPKGFPMAITRYTICEMSVTWHLYGGHDFLTDDDKKKPKTKRSQSEHTFAHLPMSEAYKSGVSYSKGSPSVNFGPTPAQKLTWKCRGGPERRHDIMMEVQINKVKFSHEIYPPTTEQASRQVLLITELEIWDRLAISDIKKFLYQSSVGQRPNKGNNHMVVIKALHLRPNPALNAQECCLRISVLPIRLNIDQDSLLFLVNFFNQLGGGSDLTDPTPQYQQTTSRVSQTTPPHQQPVMMVELPEAAQELHARKMVSENLMLLIEEEEKSKEHAETSSELGDDLPPIYFRNVIFGPDVPIRIDYHGKRVELSHGPLAGLLMGLGQLQCSEIRLKKISYRHGLLGVDRLLNFLLQEWLQDIKKKQLPKILGGVGPMYSLVQLFQGIWDLFWLPIEQYQKDGRIVRGLQRGAQSFTARTALAALEITTRIIHLLQITAETAYDMVSPGPSVRRGRGNKKGKRKRLHPPQDIREGMTNAIQIVKEGFSDTAHNLVELTALEHDQKGYTGAVGAVMRQIPPMVVQPIVLAAQATSNVLGGVKNQLVPDARAEAREKYKDDVE